MKVAVQIICYNEEETLASVIKNWLGKVHTITVFHSDKPWHGQELQHDRSERICKALNVEFVRLPWKSETEQRNWALAYHYRFDYVLIVDADELYTEKDQDTLLQALGVPPEDGLYDNLWVYRTGATTTYFKTKDWKLEPADIHRSVIAVDPKRTIFKEHRLTVAEYHIPLPITLHHLSYLRKPERMRHKLQQFEHHDAVKRDYFRDVFMKWQPGDDMVVRAYGVEKSKAVPAEMPGEIADLIRFNQEMLDKLPLDVHMAPDLTPQMRV